MGCLNLVVLVQGFFGSLQCQGLGFRGYWRGEDSE